MTRFRFLLIAAAFLAAAPLFLGAQTQAGNDAALSATPALKNFARATAVPFRAGTILSAEITREKPAFELESEFDQPGIDNPAWIELIIKLNPGRTISRFDYELIGQEGTYSCFAVAEGSDRYSVDPEKWIIRKPTYPKFYRLLFPVNQSEIAAARKDLLPVTLKLKLYETALPPAEFQVRVMPESMKFTSVSRVPQEGICNMTYQELPSTSK